MESRIKNYVGIALIGALIFAVIFGFWFFSGYTNSLVSSRTFSASGEGTVVAVPDIAQFSFGVITEGGKNIADLQKENADKINKVIAFIKESGSKEKDITTEFYTIIPRYQYFNCPPERDVRPCPPPEIVGYTINQSISVKIRELNTTGAVIAGVVERGATTVSGPVFTVDDPTELQNRARKEAMMEAREKAQAIAQAGGFRLGRLVSLNEGVTPPPLPYYPEKSSILGRGGDGGAPVIEPGSQEVVVTVTLTYEIN